jgi:hypothetical protein
MYGVYAVWRHDMDSADREPGDSGQRQTVSLVILAKAIASAFMT